MIRRCLALLIGLLATASAGALELRMLMAWDESYPAVRYVAERYARKVDEASHGEVTFALTGPAAIPAFEQLQPVVLGIFDLLLTHGAYHLDTTGIGLALDAIHAGPRGLRESGVWDAVDRSYQTHGLKLLALPIVRAGYQLFLRDPIGPDCTLRGRRIRASPSYAALLGGLGAQALMLPIGEVHAALAHKQVDGVAWSTIGTLPYQWYEVSRYLMRPTFGTVTHLLLMNLDTWQHLPLDLQRLLLEQGDELENTAYKRFKKVAGSEENELSVAGMQVTTLCLRQAEQLPRYWADSVWQIAIEHAGDEARALREMARKSGLTP